MDLRTSAELACILEATARKPGNVHPSAAFADMTFLDFLRSAVAVGPVLAAAKQTGVGKSVRLAIECSRAASPVNTNLGIVLLLAPLAAADRDPGAVVRSADVWQADVAEVCRGLTIEDAEHVYAAIRSANPGGMGEVPDQDLAAAPTATLVEAMSLAADRDSIARQYRDGFAELFEPHARLLAESLIAGLPLEAAIVNCALRWMAAFPDSHIARREGHQEAEECSRRAADLLAERGHANFEPRLADFDRWLREVGRKRNPGTSADLTTAALFIVLATGVLDDRRVLF